MKKATTGGGPIKFRTTLLSAGKSATGIEVPPKVVEALGSHNRPPVKVTIKGHTYRSTVAVMGGKFMVGVSAQNRKAAGVAAGDKLDVELQLDVQPREVTVPPDFKKVLKGDARRHFDRLSYSKKRYLVENIEGAKTDETRQRRIDKAVSALREGRDR
jgi:Domain of unknown function (DUF1905)/Bacteriocin-protection, YdeI or OmpD-Associated